jgi:hypothetical protein
MKSLSLSLIAAFVLLAMPVFALEPSVAVSVASQKDAVSRPSVPLAAWVSASLSRFARTVPARPATHFLKSIPHF